MFYSILFPTQEQHARPRQTTEPDCFKDLDLNQIFAPILKNYKEFALEGLFFTSLRDREAILYRQDVFRELEDDCLRELCAGFSQTVYGLDGYLRNVAKALSTGGKHDNNYLVQGRVLDYADQYCREVTALAEGLRSYGLHSTGLTGFAQYLSAYSESEAFKGLLARTRRLREELSTVEYCMLVQNGAIRVRKYEGQADHSQQLIETFEKFRQGDVKDYRRRIVEAPYAPHVEEGVLNLVAGLYKDIFADLKDFCGKYLDFMDDTIARFARELPFYLSWLEYIRPLRKAGLPFNYPVVCDTPEHLYTVDGFDLALAAASRKGTVMNDFTLDTPERIIVVTGPNQGGKTTFARSFGQTHWLMSLGLCVPGVRAALYLFDDLLTHFSRAEDLATLNGKLQDDLVRLHALLERATRRSVIVINEIFASTTLADALILGGHMVDAIAELGAPAVIVTFLDELALHGEETVSMMSTVQEDDPSQRTFKVIRKPPDGLAYAMHLAGRHGLTYEQLGRRLNK